MTFEYTIEVDIDDGETWPEEWIIEAIEFDLPATISIYNPVTDKEHWYKLKGIN